MIFLQNKASIKLHKCMDLTCFLTGHVTDLSVHYTEAIESEFVFVDRSFV